MGWCLGQESGFPLRTVFSDFGLTMPPPCPLLWPLGMVNPWSKKWLCSLMSFLTLSRISHGPAGGCDQTADEVSDVSIQVPLETTLKVSVESY